MTLFDFRDDENLTAASNILQNMRLQIQQVRVNLNFFARHANSPSYSSRRLQPFFRQKGRLPFVEQFSMSPRHMTIFRSNVSAITLEGCSHMNSCMFLWNWYRHAVLGSNSKTVSRFVAEVCSQIVMEKMPMDLPLKTANLHSEDGVSLRPFVMVCDSSNTHPLSPRN